MTPDIFHTERLAFFIDIFGQIVLKTNKLGPGEGALLQKSNTFGRSVLKNPFQKIKDVGKIVLSNKIIPDGKVGIIHCRTFHALLKL